MQIGCVRAMDTRAARRRAARIVQMIVFVSAVLHAGTAPAAAAQGQNPPSLVRLLDTPKGITDDGLRQLTTELTEAQRSNVQVLLHLTGDRALQASRRTLSAFAEAAQKGGFAVLLTAATSDGPGDG